MGLQAIRQASRTSTPLPAQRIYPYLLNGLTIDRADRVWCADITYIPVRHGFLYLVAIMGELVGTIDPGDRSSRERHAPCAGLAALNTLDSRLRVEALDEALARYGRPEIFNTDQGSQFTSLAFTGRPQAADITISGRGA